MQLQAHQAGRRYLGAAGGEDDVLRPPADHLCEALPGCADRVLGLPTWRDQKGGSLAWLYQVSRRL